MPPLFAKRSVPLPTRRGCLLLFILLLILFLISLLTLRSLPAFLAPHAPLSPNAHPTVNLLVVEGWAPDFVFETAALVFEEGRHQRIAALGGHIPFGRRLSNYDNYAGFAAEALVVAGVPEDKILLAPAIDSDRHRTYHNALGLRRALLDRGELDTLSSLEIYTADVHARRSRLVMERVFRDRDIAIGVVPVSSLNPGEIDRGWWTASDDAKAVIAESIAYVYERLFGPRHPAAE